MKVIFLDIDGVLNTSKTFRDIYYEYKETGKRRVAIDEKRVLYLKEIVDRTESCIVLSSSWRITGTDMKKLIDIFNKYGLTIFDITPIDSSRIREREILLWMQDKEIESFIVIDDDSYDLQLFIPNKLIKTRFTLKDGSLQDIEENCGLCQRHIAEAIEKMNKKYIKLIKT